MEKITPFPRGEYYGLVRGHDDTFTICSALEDGTIPINSVVLFDCTGSESALKQLVERGNYAIKNGQ